MWRFLVQPFKTIETMKKSLLLSLLCLMGIMSAQAKTIVTYCELSGFANHITYGMTWNQAALDAVLADFKPVDPNAVYHVDVPTTLLKKFNGIYGEKVEFGTILEEGEYEVWAFVAINEAEKANYAFSTEVSEKPVVTVDGVEWTVRPSSSTEVSIETHIYLASPEEMEEARKSLGTWMEIVSISMSVLQMQGETQTAKVLSDALSPAIAVYSNENATLSQINEQTQLLIKAVDDNAEKISVAIKESAKTELDSWVDPDDSEALKQIVADAKAEIDKLITQSTAMGIMGILIPAVNDIMDNTEKNLNDQYGIEKEQAKEDLEIYLDAASILAEYKMNKGEAAKAAEIALAIDEAEKVLDDESANLSDFKSQIAILDPLVSADTDELLAAIQWGYTYEWTMALEVVDGEECKKALTDAIAAINAITWDKSKSVVENYNIINKAAEMIQTKLDETMKDKCEVQGLENVNGREAAHKAIRNGMLLIERGGKTFNATGAEMK